jgi:HK97 family phage major capsid protein
MDGVINAAAENYIMVYGDIGQAYRINDRIGMSIELVPHLFGVNRRPTGERGWFARWRVGAGIVNGAAARVLNIT